MGAMTSRSVVPNVRKWYRAPKQTRSCRSNASSHRASKVPRLSRKPWKLWSSVTTSATSGTTYPMWSSGGRDGTARSAHRSGGRSLTSRGSELPRSVDEELAVAHHDEQVVGFSDQAEVLGGVA